MSKATIISVIAALCILFLASQVIDQPDDTTAPTTSTETTSEETAASETVESVTPPAPLPRGGNIEVYDGIRVPENSTTLDLSGRGLTGSLKAEVRLLSQLRELNLSNNQFTGLPAEIGQLRELRVLILSNNPLTGLPLELGNLQNLEVLDLRGTNYAAQDVAQIEAALPASTEILK